MAELGALLWTVAVAVLPLPAEGPAVANALLFTAPVAIATTWLGCFLGAALSFELARRGGRPLASRVLGTAGIERIDRLGTLAGAPSLLGLRLLPAVSFTGINWAAGLAGVERRTFYLTTGPGILPGCIAFTLIAQGGTTWIPAPYAQTLGIALVVLGVSIWLVRTRAWRRVKVPVFHREWAHPLRIRTLAGATGGALLAGGLFLMAPPDPEPSMLASHTCVSAPAPKCCRGAGPHIATEPTLQEAGVPM